MEKTMDIFESRYYKLNKMLLSAVAIWPSADTFLKRVKIIVLGCLCANLLMLQIAPFVTNEFSANLFIETISFAIPTVIVFSKFLTFHINSKRIMQMLEHMQQDWRIIKKEAEYDILKEYAEIGRWYLLVIAFSIYGCLFVITLYQLVPDFLDILMPLNKSRLHDMSLILEFIGGKEKYYYFLFLDYMIALIAAATVLISSETLTIASLYHAASLFRITSYRVEHMFDSSVSRRYNINKNYAVNSEIIKTVKLHRRALKFIEDVIATFQMSYSILLYLAVLCLILHLSQTLQSQNSFIVFFIHLLYCSCNYAYMFFLTYATQMLLDHSTDIYKCAYNSQWYTASVPLQKQLLIIIQRSMKDNRIVLGGVFTASLETFVSVTRMSLSYTMVIYSTMS